MLIHVLGTLTSLKWDSNLCVFDCAPVVQVVKLRLSCVKAMLVREILNEVQNPEKETLNVDHHCKGIVRWCTA